MPASLSLLHACSQRGPLAVVSPWRPPGRARFPRLFTLSMVASSLGCIGAAAAPDPSAGAIDDYGDAGFVVDLPAFDGSWTPTGTARDASVRGDPPPPMSHATPDVTTPIGPSSIGPADGDPPAEAASETPGVDSALLDDCPGPPGPGDLAIDELMITAVAGTGDYGEWIEVRSTRACSLQLQGLHGECPDGAKVRTFDVGSDMSLPPFGTFLVADSSDPAVNHDLPGPLLVWAGHVGDVLRKDGATITLTMGGRIVDTVTYPSLKLGVGQSLAFPSDCDASVRSDWTVWQPSVASWFPAFFGTPNAPNGDVHCPYRPRANDEDAGPQDDDAAGADD